MPFKRRDDDLGGGSWELSGLKKLLLALRTPLNSAHWQVKGFVLPAIGEPLLAIPGNAEGNLLVVGRRSVLKFCS